VWIFYKILNEIGDCERIDLFIYSRGGDASVPWKLVSLIRKYCEEFNVLIPFRAHSAATMIALGADNIICCSGAELGPIDPSLTTPFNPRDPQTKAPIQINIEAVRAYLEEFVKDVIKNDDERLKALEIFINRTNPLAIGEIFRQTKYIRQVAKKIMETSKKNKRKDLDKIIRKLIEETYHHRHAITSHEAKEIGLNVEFARSDLEKLMISLINDYLEELQYTKPLTPWGFVNNPNQVKIPIAFIESMELSYVFNVTLQPSFKRQMPQNFQFTMNLQLPPEIKELLQEDPNLNKLINEFARRLAPQIQQMVIQELQRQAPVVGMDIKIIEVKWEKL